jgi:hypothetical protein
MRIKLNEDGINFFGVEEIDFSFYSVDDNENWTYYCQDQSNIIEISGSFVEESIYS